MITYKPSSRLGLLNEENFTSDPTSRGWSVSVTNYTANYTVDGLRLDTDLSKTSSATIEINTKLLQFISFIVYVPNGHDDWSVAGPNLILKLDNNTLIETNEDVTSQALSEGNLTVTVFKNTANQWFVYYGGGQYDSSARYSGVLTKTPNLNSVSNIQFTITSTTPSSGTAPQNIYLRSVKWV